MNPTDDLIDELREAGERDWYVPGHRLIAAADALTAALARPAEGDEPTAAMLTAGHAMFCSDVMTYDLANAYKAMRALALSTSRPAQAEDGWKPIETAPNDGIIEVRGNAGPYGVLSWTALAKWGLPVNWHKSDATWLSPEGAVLHLAGYRPSEWRTASIKFAGE